MSIYCPDCGKRKEQSWSGCPDCAPQEGEWTTKRADGTTENIGAAERGWGAQKTSTADNAGVAEKAAPTEKAKEWNPGQRTPREELVWLLTSWESPIVAFALLGVFIFAGVYLTMSATKHLNGWIQSVGDSLNRATHDQNASPRDTKEDARGKSSSHVSED